MGKKEFSSAFSNASDTTFRAWVGAWIQGWKDAGLAQSADTGQIDPLTALAPTGTAAIMRGYAIFYLNDSLHGAAPIYLKVEFGGFGATAPALMITVGKSTDGAGNLGGIVLPRTYLGNTADSFALRTATPSTHIAASGDGYFAFLPFTDFPAATSATTNGSGGYSFILERSRNVDGSPSPAGVTVAYSYNPTTVGAMSGNAASSCLPIVRAINYASLAYTQGIPPVSIPYSVNGVQLGPGTSFAAGSIGPVFPWVLLAPGLAPWQSCVIVSIPAGDFPGGVFTTTLCGNAATFRAVPASLLHRWGLSIDTTASNAMFSGYIGPAIRWED